MVRFLIAPGLVIGIGLGGLFDRLFVRHVLCVHDMLAGWRVKPSLAEGWLGRAWPVAPELLFLVLTGLGVSMLWRAAGQGFIWSSKAFNGAILAGWGALVGGEALISHHLIGAHHVGAVGAANGDYLFLIWGAVMAVVGRGMIEEARRHVVTPPPPPHAPVR